MTREEAINVIKGARQYLTVGNPIWNVKKVDEAMNMAIEALQDRPKGEWIPHTTSVGLKHYAEYARCSECGKMALVHMNFCPNCGADMRGGGERREE